MLVKIFRLLIDFIGVIVPKAAMVSVQLEKRYVGSAVHKYKLCLKHFEIILDFILVPSAFSICLIAPGSCVFL